MMLGALSSLLDLEDDLKVIGKASNGAEAVSLVHRYQPDICIMDIDMPEKSGLDAADEIKGEKCKVIILTTIAQSGYLQRALDANVGGYLLKDNTANVLIDSIHTVLAGGKIYAPELLDEIVCENDLITNSSSVKSKNVNDEISINQNNIHQNRKSNAVRNYFSFILDKLEGSKRQEVSQQIRNIRRFR